MIRTRSICCLFFFLILSFFAASQSQDQPPTPRKLEDFHRYYQDYNDDSLRIFTPAFLEVAQENNKPLELAWAQFYYCLSYAHEEAVACQSLLVAARNTFKSHQEKETYFKTTFNLANVYLIDNQPEVAIPYYQEIIVALEKGDTSQFTAQKNFRLGKTYAYLSRSHAQINQLEPALETALKCFDYIQKTNNQVEQFNAATTLGNIYTNLSKEKLSRKYQFIGLQIAETLQIHPYIHLTLNNIGSTFLKEEQPDSALIYFQRALQGETELKDSTGMGTTLLHLAETYTLKNDLNTGYHFSEATLSLAKQFQDKNLEASALLNMGEIAIIQREYQQAVYLIQSAIQFKKESQNYLGLDQDYALLHEAHLGNKDPLAALESFQRSTQLKDSLLNLEMRSRIEALQTQFETAQKEQEIDILSKQNKLQQLQFNQRITLLSAGSFGLLLMISIVIFYNRQQLLIQKNKALETEQRLLRAQMNPHFTFNVLATIQTYLLNNGQAQKAAYYLTKFAKLIRQILDHSRVAFVSLEKELNSLENYLSVQQLRYDQGFQYHIDLPDNLETDQVLVPPMLIQPTLENAIEHGRVYMQEAGKILIKIESKNSAELAIQITDNGIGRIAAQEQKVSMAHQSVSTKIIEDRIQLLRQSHHPAYAYRITDLPQGGTCVTFNFPIP